MKYFTDQKAMMKNIKALKVKRSTVEKNLANDLRVKNDIKLNLKERQKVNYKQKAYSHKNRIIMADKFKDTWTNFNIAAKKI